MEQTLKPAMTEGRFHTPDGAELFERRWEISDAVAAVAIIHGFGEHSGRYGRIAARLNAEKYSVYAYDQRHHGQSPGKMGYITSFATLADDASRFVERIRAIEPDQPLFVFGHSMGALVTAFAVLRNKPPVRGLVLSSGALKAGDDVSPLLQRVSAILAAVLPWVPVLTLDPKALSRDPAVVQAYETDPLVYHGKILARTGHQMMRAINEVQSRAKEITIPFIALHGTQDRLADCRGSKLFYEHAGSADKTLKLYEGACHEVFNDTDKEQFLTDVIEWLNARR